MQPDWYQTILNSLGKPFHWSRWGDGEWLCLMGTPGANCDGHLYYQDLGHRLLSILESKPGYHLGLQGHAERTIGTKADFIRLKAMNRWVESDTLHHASIHGELSRFFEALKEHRVVLVANRRLESLKLWNHFVPIPEKNCWLNYENVRKQVANTVKKGDVVLYCASMMSNVLIDDFSTYPITQLDCGSVFDPYVGIKSRSYHKNLGL